MTGHLAVVVIAAMLFVVFGVDEMDAQKFVEGKSFAFKFGLFDMGLIMVGDFQEVRQLAKICPGKKVPEEKTKGHDGRGGFHIKFENAKVGFLFRENKKGLRLFGMV